MFVISACSNLSFSKILTTIKERFDYKRLIFKYAKHEWFRERTCSSAKKITESKGIFRTLRIDSLDPFGTLHTIKEHD